MPMISVLAKRRLVFTHPKMRNSEAVKMAIATAEPNKPLEGYFATQVEPFRAQPAPDWIKTDPLWAIAERKGFIFEVPMPAVQEAIPEALPATAGQQVLVVDTKSSAPAAAPQGAAAESVKPIEPFRTTEMSGDEQAKELSPLQRAIAARAAAQAAETKGPAAA